MYCVRKVTEDLYWVGANDRRLTLFENIHPIPRGVSYNSYLLLDKKTVLFDTVDWSAGRQFIENVEAVLAGRKLDYLVINHMEPDHGASIEEIILRYPEVKIISTEKAFLFMRQFGFSIDGRIEEVKEGDTRCFGKHTVTFVAAPMVHWPEAMVTFDTTNGVLFAADAFGSFGSLDGKLFNDEVNFDRDWIDDARRYYTNIVGKYGPQVQALLKKAGGIDIKMICPLHGPVWRTDLGYFLDKYDKWSRYEPEETGVMIAYASMYGNTEAAANSLATALVERGMTNVVMYDVSKTHVSQLISETFRLSHIVLASVTYNLGIYPVMHNYLMDMKALNLQKRTVAIIENGSWACKSGSLMRDFLENNMKQMTVLDEKVTLSSAMREDNLDEIGALADSIIESMKNK
ncbi:FprA family A-type flavoprotein [Bacilliculturomica massiliensis]|uniref:FprA family A-type flavoprotein n=1 Tax=Bacilliculturomica massiliensis TaxID=1917867 RepID=UPI00102F4D01|nr:FprA family A-type flavoprotein [Bacilliculturomica massiliensis]